jgi:hypothetical protein
VGTSSQWFPISNIPDEHHISPIILFLFLPCSFYRSYYSRLYFNYLKTFTVVNFFLQFMYFADATKSLNLYTEKIAILMLGGVRDDHELSVSMFRGFPVT